MASRSPEKAGKAIEELKKETGKEAIYLELDLAKYSSIHKAADEFLRQVLWFNLYLMMFSPSLQQRGRSSCLIQQCVRILHSLLGG